jgi:hypothetical protein
MQTKLILLFVALSFAATTLFAQKEAKMPGVDKSPADLAYFRNDAGPLVKVVYSRPMKKGREVFGGIVSYDKVWRTGANEATEITFYQDVTFGGEPIEAGTYTLFTKPGETSWGIMLNSELDQWGAYKMDMEKTVLTTSATPTETQTVIEPFTITFRKVDGGAHLIMAWDKTMVEVPIMM